MSRHKKVIFLLAAVLFVLGLFGCGRQKAYKKEFYTLFETISSLTVYTDSEEEFEKTARFFEDELTRYHRLFDIYNEYDGMANLKTVNDNAGTAPVKVDKEIIGLLKFCREMYEKTDGEVNAAFGSVLEIWHDYREEGMENPESAKLPPMKELQAAAEHTDMNDVVIDEEKSTVYLKDKEMSLDVGAIAKGYAVEKIGDEMEDMGIKSALIDVGGNIKAVGQKSDGSQWRLGLQNPDLESDDVYVHTIKLKDKSLVTSGNYQRYYTVDGKRYHHIIQPETLMPSDEYASVSVICDDSGIGDALSTALFNMDEEKGRALAESFNAEVLWIRPDGSESMTDGFKDYIDK